MLPFSSWHSVNLQHLFVQAPSCCRRLFRPMATARQWASASQVQLAQCQPGGLQHECCASGSSHSDMLPGGGCYNAGHCVAPEVLRHLEDHGRWCCAAARQQHTRPRSLLGRCLLQRRRQYPQQQSRRRRLRRRAQQRPLVCGSREQQRRSRWHERRTDGGSAHAAGQGRHGCGCAGTGGDQCRGGTHVGRRARHGSLASAGDAMQHTPMPVASASFSNELLRTPWRLNLKCPQFHQTGQQLAVAHIQCASTAACAPHQT